MQLIKLSSNKSSFKTVNFKTNSLNIITGSKSDKENEDLKKTFNGVGKSFLLNIINFCLGASKYPSFEDKLKGWEFILDFQIGDVYYIAKRKTDNQDKIILNDTEYSVKKYNDFLKKELFIIPEGLKELSFRTLIKRFLRVEKESSREWDVFKSEKPYNKLLNTAFLLGIDVGLIQGKKDLKSKLDGVIDSKNRLEKDELFKKFFLGVDDINIKISDYEDNVRKLERDISNFKIAENYKQIENEVNEIQNIKKEIYKNIFIIKNQLKSIQEFLKIKVNLSLEEVFDTYKQINVEFPSLIKRKIEEVEEFHKNIIETRQTRLLTSKYTLSKELKELEDKLTYYGNELDSKTKFLSEHGALDEYDSINKKLSEEKNILSRLQSFSDIILEYKKNINKLKIDIANQNELAINYIGESKEIIKDNNHKFRELAKRFYPDSSSGISIIENTNDNTIQFDIDVKIDYDTSDGIGEIKIFCFDLLLLLLKRNHSIDFIFHDSRILSDVDSRQTTTLFLLVLELIKTHSFQYIISINQDTLNSIKSINNDLYEELKKYVILELTDESAETKLLGMNINIDYEK